MSNNATSAKTNFDKAIEVASKKDYTPYLYTGKAYIAIEKPDFAAGASNLIQKLMSWMIKTRILKHS